MATAKKPTGRTTTKGTRPGNGAKPRASKVTSAKAWKSSARTPVELELPSGNVCLALNKGMQAFMKEGNIPNSLMPIVNAAIKGAETGKKPHEMFAAASEDDDLLRDMLTMTDTVMLSCVQQPQILPVPVAEIPDPDGEEGATKFIIVEENDSITQPDGQVIERDPNALYVDEVDLEDKMFIFQWAVGGTESVDQFRSQFSATMEDLSDG